MDFQYSSWPMILRMASHAALFTSLSDDKCKNESIWLAYNRADKTHFARYLKRKMTTAQFEQWSRYTVELRQKAENSEMELADYQKELRI